MLHKLVLGDRDVSHQRTLGSLDLIVKSLVADLNGQDLGGGSRVEGVLLVGQFGLQALRARHRHLQHLVLQLCRRIHHIAFSLLGDSTAVLETRGELLLLLGAGPSLF